MKLETYEWTSTWQEKPEKSGRRILYIGDSISCGTRPQLNIAADGEFLFDGIGTSKALDNPYLFSEIALFAQQEAETEGVIFNNGLHGFHLSAAEYAHFYSDLLDKLSELFGENPIFLVLSTKLADAEKNRIVAERNDAVKKIAKEKKLEIIDLYDVSERNLSEQKEDGVHFTDKGYAAFADKILSELKRRLK